MKKIKILVAALMVFTLAFSLSGCSILNVLQKQQPKDFEKAGLTITLDESFVEQELVTQTATYSSTKYVVTTLKEEKSAFEDLGVTVSDINAYAELVLTGNKLDSAIEQTDGLTHFQYEKEVGGKNATYLAFVTESEDAFWLVQFMCESKYFEESQPLFIEWAKTIKV